MFNPRMVRLARNYHLTLAGKDGKVGTRDDIKAVPSVRPVPSGSTVRLKFAPRVLVQLRKQQARLFLNGVKDTLGRPMVPGSVIVR